MCNYIDSNISKAVQFTECIKYSNPKAYVEMNLVVSQPGARHY